MVLWHCSGMEVLVPDSLGKEFNRYERTRIGWSVDNILLGDHVTNMSAPAFATPISQRNLKVAYTASTATASFSSLGNK